MKVRWRSGHRMSTTGRSLGRFGGGWQWCLGVKVGHRTLVLELLIGSLRIDVSKPWLKLAGRLLRGGAAAADAMGEIFGGERRKHG